MDKLTMAHEYLRDIIKASGGNVDLVDMPLAAWGLADAMQAEADKRISKERPDVLCEVDWRLAPQHTKKWEMIADHAKWVIQDSNGVGYCNAPSFGFTGTHIVERPQ